MIDFGLSNGPRFLKIDARTGCFRVRDDDQDITFTQLIAAMDLLHVRVGWFAFTKTGISFVERVKTPQPAPIDGIEYKQGLAVRLISPDQPAGCSEALGEREMTTTSIVVRRAFAELYQEVVKQADGRNGAWPVVNCAGFRQVRGAKGTAFAPVMHVVDWQVPEPVAADTDIHTDASTSGCWGCSYTTSFTGPLYGGFRRRTCASAGWAVFVLGVSSPSPRGQTGQRACAGFLAALKKSWAARSGRLARPRAMPAGPDHRLIA